jgi:polyribonucleotide nucleotidyltransferase
MIDRPIRPLWPKGFKNEVQVICTTLSADLVTPHDILCINGASRADDLAAAVPRPGRRRADRPDRRRARRQPDAARRRRSRRST